MDAPLCTTSVSLASLKSGYQDRGQWARDLLGEMLVRNQKETESGRWRETCRVMWAWPLRSREEGGGRTKSLGSHSLSDGVSANRRSPSGTVGTVA